MMGQKSIHHLCSVNKNEARHGREFSFSLGVLFPVTGYEIAQESQGTA